MCREYVDKQLLEKYAIRYFLGGSLNSSSSVRFESGEVLSITQNFTNDKVSNQLTVMTTLQGEVPQVGRYSNNWDLVYNGLRDKKSLGVFNVLS